MRFLSVTGLPSLVLAFAMLSISGQAMAQVRPPASVDAGRVRNDIEKRSIPTGAPETEITTSPLAKAPAGAANVKFVLHDVRVEGAHDIAADDIRDIYKGQLNKTVTLQDVYDIANKITLVYRNKGYILSRAVVPPQEIAKNGSVRIQIVEGFVTQYSVKGDVAPEMKAKVEEYAQQLMSKGTVSAKNLERYLLLMNDLPGIRVRSVLSPSATTAGGADLTLVVSQKKVDVLAGVDNFGNKYLGPMRYSAGLQWNSPLGGPGQINVNTLQAPDHDEIEYYSAGYQRFVGSEGTRIGVTSSYTKTEPSLPAALGGLLDPDGESYGIAFSVLHPFVRTRSFNVNGGMSFEANQNVTTYAPGLGALETNDKLRIVRATGDMTYLDGWRGFNTARVTLSQGLGVMDASKYGDSNLSRPNGGGEFTKYNGEVTRLQHVYGKINAYAGVAGQYTTDELLSSEEMGLGGSDYGRGYDLSEITGDRGLAGKFELSYRQPFEYRFLDVVEPYAFYDVGAVWNSDPGAGLAGRASLASAGVGVRATINKNLRADTFLAKPLTREVPSRGLDDQDDWRWKFSVTSNF